jgi:uncharacterized protein YegL
MSSPVQISEGIFGTDSENYAQRVPCVVIMDCSYSMDGSPIAALNEGLRRFEKELKEHEKARRSARVMLIRVGGLSAEASEVTIRAPFQDAASFAAPQEVASGTTPLGEAVILALEQIEVEKQMLRSQGHSYHRPWLFVMSDGQPNLGRAWDDACQLAQKAVAAKKASIFAIAVEGGSASDVASAVRELQKITNREVKVLEDVKFGEFFVWLSRSIAGASDDASENPAMAKDLGWSRA